MEKFLNVLVVLGVYFLKLLNLWMFKLPMKIGMLSMVLYMGVAYLIFDTTDMHYIERQLGKDSFAMFIYFVLIGIPSLISFAVTLHFFIGESSSENFSDRVDNSLNGVLYYRNQKMKHASPEEAYKIARNTAHLDMIDKDPNFKTAKIGFKNKYGNAGPEHVFKEMNK